MANSYLTSVTERFQFYKDLGEKTLDQVPDEKLRWSPDAESAGLNVLVKHLAGNMISRFTDFLTSDGEKSWRNREEEFIDDLNSRAELMGLWGEGWRCVFSALETLKEEDLEKTIYIRAEAHTVIEALNRQLGHYAYHIGQMVYLAKMICGDNWQSLSIPKGKSEDYNKDMFSKND